MTSGTPTVILIIGTRPEAIKLAPVALGFQRLTNINCRVCLTGQHREMAASALNDFGLLAQDDLGLMRPGQTLAALTSRAVEALDAYLADKQPDLIIVQGDTTTVFCASLAAFYQRIPVGHVEAGLRTGNLAAPWPEEANRTLTARLADLHFAPTLKARQNLLNEGISPSTIHVTGNTVVDALLIAKETVSKRRLRVEGLLESLQPFFRGVPSDPTDTAVNGRTPYVLITGHRRENFGDGFESICRAIAALAARFPKVHFIYPVHLNPRVQEPVHRILGTGGGNVHLIPPVPYLTFVALMLGATLILTDSGGVQEEAPSLGKPVLVMRETTERPEAIAAGTAVLVGTDQSRIVQEVSKLLLDEQAYLRMSRAHDPYGDGHASKRIIDLCLGYLKQRQEVEPFPAIAS